jgi:iron complex outermembrane receptor protein
MTPGQCMELGSGSPLTAAMDPDQCDDSFQDKLAFYGHAPKNSVTAQGHTLAVEWDIDDMTVRSITAYRKVNDNYYGFLFAGGANFLNGSVDVSLPGVGDFPAQANHTKQHQFSQELQLLGDIGDRIEYSTGLYYFRERGTETKGYGTALVAFAPVITLASMNGPRDLDVSNDSMAAFGQLTWTPPILDDALEIIPGIRFTRDDRKASMFERRGGAFRRNPATGLFGEFNSGSSAPTYITSSIIPEGTFPLTGAPAEFDKSFSKTTPSLTLQYHIDQDRMLYAKYVKGYKSGGTAVRASTTGAFEDGFAPETLESYELGLKSSWLDQQLRVNVDVFQSKFEDQQVSVRNEAAAANATGTIPFDIFNAGSSTYDGAELEIQAAITDNLRLSANYAYLHFEYDKVEDPTTGTDVTDYYHNVVPREAYSVAVDYAIPDLSIGRLDFNLTYSYTDRAGIYQDNYTIVAGQASQSVETDTRQFVTPSYGLWNGRVALSEIKVGPSDKGRMTVALWGRNLADKEYESYNYVTVAQAAQYQAFWGEPRTLGIDVVYKYE